jgi:hypothetical protein
MLASSHPDEVSWEAASLGHGLSTYCFSLREAEMGSEIGIAGRGGIKTWSAYAGLEGCSVATAAAQNPIVYQGDAVETCFQRIDDGWGSEEELLRSLKAVRDDLYVRFEPFRSRRKSDLSDADIDGDTAKQLALSRRVDEDEVSAQERAEALRAFRRAWWFHPRSG